jgi:P-type conjugative transfer protein TrbJ
MRNIKSVVAGLFLVLVANNAMADKIVFDPTNFVKNATSAAQNAAQTTKLAAQYQLQIQQYANMLQNVKKLDSNTIAKGVGLGALDEGGHYQTVSDAVRATNSAYGAYHALENNMYRTSTAYDELARIGRNMSTQSASTGIPVDELLRRDIENAKAGQVNAAQRFNALKTVNGQLKDYEFRRTQIASQIPANSGLLESMSTMSQSALTTNDQLSSLLQITADKRSEELLTSSNAAKEKQKDLEITKAGRDNQKSVSKSIRDGF